MSSHVMGPTPHKVQSLQVLNTVSYRGNKKHNNEKLNENPNKKLYKNPNEKLNEKFNEKLNE